MTRTGRPNAAAFRRTQPSRVRLPSRRRALARPMRVLNPPARMHTSTVAAIPVQCKWLGQKDDDFWE